MTVLTREFVGDLELRADGRTLEGTVVPYGEEARIAPGVVEVWRPGAFAGTEPSDVPLLALRDRQTLPIGVAVELRDEPARWFGAFRVSKTRLGDEVLELVNDRALTGLSVGFLEVLAGNIWNATGTRVERIRAQAHHVGVVPFPAFASARVEAVRSAAPTEYPLLFLAQLMRRHG